MKLEIVIDGEEKTVVLTEVDGQYVAEIDGESRTYSVETPEPDVILLKNEGAIFEATVGKVGETVARRSRKVRVGDRKPPVDERRDHRRQLPILRDRIYKKFATPVSWRCHGPHSHSPPKTMRHGS